MPQKDYTLTDNKELLHYNTFGMQAKAKVFIEYRSITALQAILQLPLLADHKILHIGGGSNLLFTSDYDGVVLHSAISQIEKIAETKTHVTLKATAGVIWDNFVAYCVDHHLGGVENLSLIPGEVGASAIQNIGAYGVEAKDIISTVEAIEIATQKPRIFTNKECMYSYRSSIFKHELQGKYIITAVNFLLNKQPIFQLKYSNLSSYFTHEAEITLAKIRQIIIKIREEKLPSPTQWGNAGSFFMNPIIPLTQYELLQITYPQIPHYKIDSETVKVPAAWLIEQCGWKGKSYKGAAVYEKQPLVLINNYQATAEQILTLADLIIQSVKEKFGIAIRPEVIYI